EDEIGELSHAFNRMTANLKQVMASKVDLEKEIMERKRAEESLRESEERLEALYFSMTEGIANHEIVYEHQKAVDYIITDVNPAFESITGIARSEAVGRNASELYQTGSPPYLDIYARVASNCVPESFETYFPPMDKHFAVSVFSPEKGKFATVFVDITERRRAEEALRKAHDELELRVTEQTAEIRAVNEMLEQRVGARTVELQSANQSLLASRLAALNLMEDTLEAQKQLEQVNARLRESEQRLSRAQEIAHLGSWELDLVTDRLTWSDEVYRIFGLQPQEFGATYKAFIEAVHPDDRAAVDAAYATSIREGRDRYEIEHRVVKRLSGEIRIVYEKCEHFRDETGQIIRSVGMVHDITERKLVEEALLLSEEKYRLLADNSNDWIYWIKPDKSFQYISPSCERVTGFSSLEIVNNPGLFIEITHPEDQERVESHLEEMQDEDETHNLEYRIITKKDEIRWISHSCTPVFTGEGEYMGRNGTNRDITERKQAEEALRKAHDELELRVRERTKELAVTNRELVKEIAERKEVEKQLRIQTTAMEAAANGIVITDRWGNIQWTNPALIQITGYETRELIGQSMRIFKSGTYDADYYRQMWATILSGQVWRGEVINRRKDGSLYMEEQTITPVRDENNQIQHFIAIKQDISERKRAEAELAEWNIRLQALSIAEREQRQLSESLAEAALVLNQSMKLDEVLPLILEQVKAVIPYQLAIVMMFDGESFYDASHEGDPRWSQDLSQVKNRFPLEDFPLLIRMRQSHQPVLIPDTQKETNWMIVHGLEWGRSILCVPLLAENQVLGFLNLLEEQPDFFTTEMKDRLVVFASHAAVAIQNAWLFEQVRASNERLQSLSRRLVEIQENERLYIARELHDEAGQMLTSLMLDLVTLETQAYQPEAVLKKVTEMEESLNAVSENLHSVAMALRPASLDHLGLVPALRQYLESVGERYKLKVSFGSGNFQERLPANMETELYRIVQEALTNVVRHAHASQVDVILTVRDTKLIVMVEDDGNGFNPEKVPDAGHLGLFGMRERAEMIGAQLVIESKPGKGTTVMVEVDYDSPIVNRR
ncbi:MAG: PAS domain S-box protein, partial [Chloroflexi bacterium]